MNSDPMVLPPQRDTNQLFQAGMMHLYMADLIISDQSLDSEIQSPNDMLVDPDEYVVEPPENEKDDLAVINPDDLSNDNYDQLPSLPMADDCMS